VLCTAISSSTGAKATNRSVVVSVHATGGRKLAVGITDTDTVHVRTSQNVGVSKGRAVERALAGVTDSYCAGGDRTGHAQRGHSNGAVAKYRKFFHLYSFRFKLIIL